MTSPDKTKAEIEQMLQAFDISHHAVVVLTRALYGRVDQAYIEGQQDMLRHVVKGAPALDEAADPTSKLQLKPYYLIDKNWADTLLASMAK